MSAEQFTHILTNIAATLTEERTAERDRLVMAGLQVANALTLLEQPQYEAGGKSEADLMDADLEAYRGNKVSLIVRLTDTQLAEIEAERWGE